MIASDSQAERQFGRTRIPHTVNTTDTCGDETKSQETDVPNGYVFGLYDNASLTFTGDFQADAISNAGHLFENQGDAGISIE